jgi:hypothetical protein
MAPKSGKEGAKGKGKEEKRNESGGGKQKAAQSINVRHILVRLHGRDHDLDYYYC